MATQHIPAFVFDSCRDYQQDHANFVSWLGHSAAKCGLFPKVKSTSKVAKAKSARTRTRTKYLLALNEYVPFAKAIVSRTSISSSAIRCLRRIVSKRKECAKWYGMISPHDGHMHMIEILEEVLELFLEKRQDKSQKPPNEGKAFRKTADESRNAFEALNEQHEGDQRDTDEFDIGHDFDAEDSKWALTVADKSATIYEPAEPSKDVSFHIFNFFRLCDQLRTYIKDIWSDYHVGKLDLVAASVTTDSAIGIVEKAEEDLMKYLDDSNQLLDKIGYQRTGLVLFDQLGKSIGEPPCKIRGGKIGIHIHLIEHATYLCLETYLLMMEFLGQQKNFREPVVQDLQEQGLCLDLGANRATLSPDKQLEENRIILQDALADIKMVEINQWDVNRWPAQDKILTGIRAATQTNILLTWHVFAAQVFLDTVHILRVEVVRPFEELKLSSKVAMEHLNLLDKYSKIIDLPQARGVEDIADMALELIQEYIEEDPFPKWYKDFGFDRNDGTVRDHQFKRPQFGLLSKHPILCGLMMFRLQLLVQDVGVGLDFFSGTLVSTAYLYNEARNQGLCEEWSDMETMIKFYGKKKLWFGSRPTTAFDSVKRINLYFGMSAAELAPAQSKQKKISTKQRGISRLDVRQRSSGRRRLANPSLLSQMFLGRYCPEYYENFPTQDLGGINLQDIEALIQAQVNETESVGVPEPRPSKNGGKSFNWTALSNSFRKSHKLTHMQFLNTLQKSLAAECSTLAFSNISMHIRCTKVLSSICQNVGPALQDVAGMKIAWVDQKRNHVDLDLPSARYMIAGPVLQMAIVRNKFSKLFPNEKMPHDPFEETAKIINKVVIAEGCAESEKIHKLHEAYQALRQKQDAKAFKENFDPTKPPEPRTTPHSRVLGTHRPTLGEINVLYAHLHKLQGKVAGVAALPEQEGGPFMRMYTTQGLLSLLEKFATIAEATKLEGTKTGGGGYRIDADQWEAIGFMLTILAGVAEHLAETIKQAIWYQVYELIEAVGDV